MARAQLETLLWHIHKLAGRGSPQRTDRQLLDDFSARRDQAAFAALVARHGPMVLRVCRRVLNHEQDAEDAFQATFLVLVQNTRSIRKREALAQWLHGVAYRTAMKAKRSAARRRSHEAELRTLPLKAAASPTWDDVQAVLDEEIQRLPEAFRAVFVLCVLEGKSGPEAAAELRVKPGTISSRLTRARQRLQQQLARRGIELSALSAALAVAESAAQSGVPAALASVTVRSGLLVAAGGTAAGVIPAHVAILAAGVTRAMFLTKAKFATAILLTVSLLAGSAGIITHQALAGKPIPPQATATKPAGKNSRQLAAKQESSKPKATPTREDASDTVAFSGRVVNPDGKPVQGANVYLLDPITLSVLERSRTEADGRYRLQAHKSQFDKWYTAEPWKLTSVLALAEGYGLGVSRLYFGKPPAREDVTIQLAKDDVPITGRLIDLQGKPVAGVQVHVRGIQFPRDGDLAAFIGALKAKREGERPQQELLIGLHNNVRGWKLDGIFPPVTSDAAGRFCIKGVGRERMADLQIDGPAIETNYIYAMTRPCEKIEVPAIDNAAAQPLLRAPQPPYTHYGAAFDHVVAPSKPVVGVVRDMDTGKPIAGAIVENSHALPTSQPRFIDHRIRLRAVTDDHGRYRITGMRRGEGNELRASPPAGQPYLMSAKEVPVGAGLDPVTVDFALKRGVWIDIRVTDKVTGEPVRCHIQYFVFVDNPYLRQAVGFAAPSPGERSSADGTFRLVGLPGRGLIAVRAGTGLSEGSPRCRC